MSTVNEIRSEAQTLREQKQYAEALERYRALWTDHRDTCTTWDGWGYAFCLRKTGRAKEGLDVCREVYKMQSDFERIRNLYGWCIYDTEIKGRDDAAIEQNEAQFLRAANAIVKLVEPGTYSPYAWTVLRVAKYYKSRAAYPAAKILEWTGKLSPAHLSTGVGHGTGSRGKPVEFASDREKWYGHRSKALFESGRYQECLELGAQALDDVPKFHSNNDIWIRWRMALSKGRLGDHQNAIYDLKDILRSKHDWFIQRDVAQLLYENNQSDQALEYAIDAALNAGDLEYKWGLFLLMGLILQSLSKPDEARKHVLLAANLRMEHEWKFPQELQTAIRELGVDVTVDTSAADLHKELKRYWESLKLANLPQVRGEIKNLVGNGKSGFIRGDDGEDYYFRIRSFQGPRKRVTPGLRVSFYVEKNPDPSKRDAAVHIEEIES
ncbi:MAG: hypothetical protein IMY80_02850 [Chloroflexi bacterium]|nr:hypothetical protein [Chloroflexota bacterium]